MKKQEGEQIKLGASTYPQKQTKHKSFWLVFFVMLAVYFVGTYFVLYINRWSMGDAVSRTANAYFVLYLHPAKLASIGFVWNPLPSLIQIPILLLKDLWPPLATHAVAGGIMSSIFAAFASAFLYSNMRRYNLNHLIALLVTACYSFNPFVFYYACNGMSEGPFFATQIVCTIALFRWYETRRTEDLLKIAIALLAGFFIRYEAFPVAAAIGIDLIIIIFCTKDPISSFDGKKTFGVKFNYTLSTAIVVFLPVLYGVLVWILLCWAIMGDPFYFLTSAYSNSSQTAADLGSFAARMQDPIVALKYMGERSLPFMLPVIPIIASRIGTRRLFKADFLLLIVMVAFPFLFHYVMLILGSSYGWLRFSCYALPTIVAFVPYELTKLKKLGRTVFLFLLICSFAVSGYLLQEVYFADYDYAAEEYEAMNQTDTVSTIKNYELAQIINEKYTDGRLLIDTVYSASIVIALDHPELLVTNINDNYEAAIKNPRANGITYIAVINPEYGAQDMVGRIHPELYHNGADWCVLVEEVGRVKIYKVL